MLTLSVHYKLPKNCVILGLLNLPKFVGEKFFPPNFASNISNERALRVLEGNGVSIKNIGFC